MIRFPDLASAYACYHAPEYQQARARRLGACDGHVVIVEGVVQTGCRHPAVGLWADSTRSTPPVQKSIR
ncbi:DUF1330 domain-containing protein [Paracoccus kondratievae]|uniref:DUF1330 domain-containing protein n=1 Tax=Paracoccus TaxID=265 RepID=UPI000A0315F5|nr:MULTISPECIES: DUF1330 domain-containing protein [Paracoccus]QFQ88542.1 DUF1330 domain-containing protein [Paracoccus kondratievae]